jgi:hypothetical protein
MQGKSSIAGKQCPALVLALLLSLVAGHSLEAQCNTGDSSFWGSSLAPARLDSNHIQTTGQSWATGNYGYLWEPWDESWQEQNGQIITSGSTGNANPGQVAEVWWTTVLNSQGPGSYNDYSYHWFTSSTCPQSPWNLGYTSGTVMNISRPTVTGVSSFWWLGPGILSDYGYYAQSALTANANGASGTPYWSFQTVSGGGSISLNRSICVNNTATSAAPSRSCAPDVTVYVNYGGFYSNPFTIFINKPSTLTLQPGYPQDVNWSQGGQPGYQSTYSWSLTDTCGYQAAGLDANEVFGTWTDDYYNSTGQHNNWGQPIAVPSYSANNIYTDTIGASYPATTPPPQWAGNGNVAVMHDSPWTFNFGSQNYGAGVAVLSDTQQWYQDHGRHY